MHLSKTPYLLRGFLLFEPLITLISMDYIDFDYTDCSQ